MFSKLRSRLTYANVMSTIACVGVLTGGTAYASHLIVNSSDIADESIQSVDIRNGQVKNADILDGSIQSVDIRNGQVSNVDLAGNAVNSRKVLDNSLTGADLNESTLGQVPSALLGGVGRSSDPEVRAGCNPVDEQGYVNCAFATLTLPAPARVLVIASATAFRISDSDVTGACVIGTSRTDPGQILESGDIVDVYAGEQDEEVSIAWVTDEFPAGTYHFGLDCGEITGNIRYDNAKATAVALSAE